MQPLNYDGLQVSIGAQDGVYRLLVWRDGAHTRRGVGIGDALDDVKSAYPAATCGTHDGGEYPDYAFCRVRLASGWPLWFGEDPVRSVGLSTTFIA